MKCFTDFTIGLLGIIGTSSSFSSSVFNQMLASKFKISNKYYSAEVNFLSSLPELDSASFGPDQDLQHRNQLQILENRVDALIVIHNETEKDENVFRSFESFLESAVEALEPAVLLYIAQDEEKLPPNTSSWCMDNGFEVISLVEPEKEEEEVFQEKTCLARAMEALESHMWPNMVFKTEARPRDDPKAATKEEIDVDDDISDIPPEILASFSDVMKFMKGEDGGGLDGGVEGTEPAMGEMDFFGPLQKLRGQLSGLDDDKRRKMASQVAMALMSALGDEDDFM